MLFTPRRTASGSEIIDSIPKLLFYTWFSLFTALSIMGAYLTWFSAGSDTQARPLKPTVTERLNPVASVYKYLKIRPYSRRAKPKKPYFTLKSAATTPCGPEAPLP